MAKTPKFDDVKHPDKVTPSATSRPIIVTNHTMMTKDPMMAPASGNAPEAGASEDAVPVVGASMTHEKTIVPLNPISTDPEDDAKDEPEEAKEPESEPESEAKPAEVTPPEPAATTPAPESEPQPQAPEVESGTGEVRDAEAEATAEEDAAAEAAAKREEELEGIIASEKYAVPINAVQRRRSRAATALLFFLAVVLAIVLLDAIVDVGIVHVPSSVPHTHFFSKN